MSHSAELHEVRNAAAVVLAALENACADLLSEDPGAPLLSAASPDERASTLSSLRAAEKAARRLVHALRRIDSEL